MSFFRSHNIKIVSSKKRNDYPSHLKRTGLLKFTAVVYKKQELCEKAVEMKE